MSDYPGTGRLEPELLAAYIDGELPPEARAKVEAEIAADPENYEWLVNVMAAVDDVGIRDDGEHSELIDLVSHGQLANWLPEPMPAPCAPLAQSSDGGPPSRPRSKVLAFVNRPAVLSGVALAVAASLVLVVQLQPEWYLRMRYQEQSQGLASLVEAVGTERYIEARVSGGFRYAPSPSAVRGEDNRSVKLELLAQSVEAVQRANRHASAENLHVAGVALLLAGTDVEQAVTLLEDATRRNQTLSCQSDLLASLIEAYRLTGKQAYRERMRTVAEGLARIDALPAEALFNRALALESLGEFTASVPVWRTYAEVSRGTEWEAEGRSRLLAAESMADAKQR